MNESLSQQGEQEARACRQMNKAVGQPFILSFIPKPPIRQSYAPRRAGVRGGGEREGAGLGRLLRNPEAESEPGQRARWVPGSRNPSLSLQSSRYPQVIQVSTRPSPGVIGSWDPAPPGPSRPSAPAIPRPTTPASRTVALGLALRPAACPFPHPAREEASRGHASAARPAPATSVPTGSALWVRGRGPGWAAWPALESAARARSPRPGPARGRAAACRHPRLGPDPGARAHPPAPPHPAPAGPGPGSGPGPRLRPRRLGTTLGNQLPGKGASQSLSLSVTHTPASREDPAHSLQRWVGG